jgi:beta-phosphoglucomutase-like phosphatase (HAD superfamily)
MLTLLLFDVDGVLIEAHGYKKALSATLDYFAGQMGLPPLQVDDDEISVFEACGLTNEWDSAAFCVAALLADLLTQRPDLQRATLHDTLDAIRAAGVSIPRPEFTRLTRQVAARNVNRDAPTAHCLALLEERTDPKLHPLWRTFLADIYSLDTPTTRIQQTHTLGSANFAAAYGQPAPLERESYLQRYDLVLLSEASKRALSEWSQADKRRFAIFTARPSLPPADVTADRLGYAPEGDMAVDLLGLNGIPLIGSGRMEWLARQYGRTPAEYIKPYPVQALAAIGAAACGVEGEALHAAARLHEQGKLTAPLTRLADQPTRVIVLEDSTGGIRATRLAVDKLQTAGLQVELEAIGVSPNAAKQAALAQVANRVVHNVDEALALIF